MWFIVVQRSVQRSRRGAGIPDSLCMICREHHRGLDCPLMKCCGSFVHHLAARMSFADPISQRSTRRRTRTQSPELPSARTTSASRTGPGTRARTSPSRTTTRRRSRTAASSIASSSIAHSRTRRSQRPTTLTARSTPDHRTRGGEPVRRGNEVEGLSCGVAKCRLCSPVSLQCFWNRSVSLIVPISFETS